MDHIQLLPLGSVVTLTGDTQKLLIVNRGMSVKNGEKVFFFDYGAVLYPRGLVSDQVIYFNHEQLQSVYFLGCNDSDSQLTNKIINDYLDAHPAVKRCTPEEWNAMNKKSSVE